MSGRAGTFGSLAVPANATTAADITVCPTPAFTAGGAGGAVTTTLVVETAVLTPLLTAGPGRGMIVNLSVDTSSADLMDFCKDIDAFYIDTVCEPWPGLYTDKSRSISERSNYALREGVLDLRQRRPGGEAGERREDRDEMVRGRHGSS